MGYVQRKCQGLIALWIQNQRKDFKTFLSLEWTTTRGENPLPFLIHASGTGAMNGAIIPGTKDTIHHLAKSDDIWYMDGTFTWARALFEPSAIGAPLGDSAISCAYGFPSGQWQETYG